MSKINYYDLVLRDYEENITIRFFNLSEYSNDEFLQTVIDSLKVDAKKIVANKVKKRKESGRHPTYPIYGTIYDLMESVFYEEMRKSGYNLYVKDAPTSTCYLDNIGHVFFTKAEDSPFHEDFHEADDPKEGQIIKELRNHIGEVEFPKIKGE